MKQNEKIMVVVAAVVAVVAVVAFVMIRSGGQSVPPTDTGTDQGQGQTTAPPGMGGSTSKPSGKLVLVPKGTALNDYLKKVYRLVKDKKYDEAFKMYPDSVQQGGLEAFKSSRKSMPVESFKVGSMTTKGDTATIPVTQTLGGQAAQGGSPNWVVTWHFKKDKKGQWAVESYDVNMGGSQ